MPLGKVDNRLLKAANTIVQLIDLISQPHSKGRRYLVVSATAGMDLFSRITDQCDEARLNK
jgi:hypothetical protein